MPNATPLRAFGPAFAVALVLGGCAAGAPDGDPYERPNRAVYGFNKGVDRVVVRPASQVYGHVLPKPVREGVHNVSYNLAVPGDVVNGVLQGDVNHAVENTFRFLINSTLGIGGIFDPATSIGVPGRQTDFGETLYTWGVPEGAFVQVPVLGPSTVRDTTGTVVDYVLNPTRLALQDDARNVKTAFDVGATLGTRYTYTGIVDDALYTSADGYAQSKLLYLQNRRFKLGDQSRTDDEFDPYDEVPDGQ